MYQTYLDLMKATAIKAGEPLIKAAGNTTIELKSKHDVVTKYDKQTEEAIVEAIIKAYPEHNILGEEYGATETNPASEYRWIIDPIDGTANFAHGHPFFCISIGLEHKKQIIAGLVHAPALNQTFWATKGGGAFLNNKPIAVSQIKTVNDALLCSGFYPGKQQEVIDNMPHWQHFALNSQGVRRCGAAALELCYVAAGIYEGYWETQLKPWDVAAGSLIVQEAGGSLSSRSGAPFNIYNRDLLATNNHIHQEILTYFKAHL